MNKLEALDSALGALAAVDLELYPRLTREELVAFFDALPGEEIDRGLVFVISLYEDVLKGTFDTPEEMLTHVAYDALMRGLPHEHMKVTEEYFRIFQQDRERARELSETLPFYDWRNALMHFAVSAVEICTKQIGGTRQFSMELMRRRLAETVAVITP